MQSKEHHTSSSSNTTIDGDVVEITLDLNKDSTAVEIVNITREANADDPRLSLLGNNEKSSTRSRTREVSEELKQFAAFSKGTQNDRSKSVASDALRRLNFVSKKDVDAGWSKVEERFDKLTKESNGLLTRDQFGECIGIIKKREVKKKSQDKKNPPKKEPVHESQDFAFQVFDALTRQRNISGGLVNKAQLCELWDLISDQSFDSRLMIFFDMIDKDSDGRVNEEEVGEIIKISASASKLPNIKENAGEYAALIMEELDPDNIGYITIEALEMLILEANTHTVPGGDNKVLSQLLSQKLKPMSHPSRLRRWYETCKYGLLDNWQRVWVMALWIGVMAGLFVYKYVQYKNKAVFEVMGHCVCMAKGAAETLKLNMALILLPVCRNTITWLRNKTRIGAAIPLDDNLKFHKIIAISISIGVGIHGISHLTCDFPRLLHATPEEYEPMEKYFGDQPSSYWWFIKGVEGVTGIIMVVLMGIAFTLASPWFRRNKFNLPKPFDKVTGFNAFWYSHHLFVIVYTLLIVHGIKLYLTKEWYNKTTWMYLSVPVILYASERFLRSFRSSVNHVQILQVAVHPGFGNVLAIHMSKPKGFGYKSGQYMLVNCPGVSPFEWHPFSITSAPGDDYLSVHIRTNGDWTGQLKAAFEKVFKHLPEGKSRILRANLWELQNIANVPRMLIDGPYGAPSQDYKNYDVVLLVGLGVGATPMISIVKDIMNNMRAEEENTRILEDGTNRTPPNGASPGPEKRSGNNFRTKRAYFYWVTGQQSSFEWFKGIMDEVAEMDHQGVIEMHNYCTSVYEEGDARSALITMLQSLNYAKNGVDVVAGIRVKCHFAKPIWKDVYKRIAINHSNSKIGVFYCGLADAATDLKQLALEFSHETSTKFDFHKENF